LTPSITVHDAAAAIEFYTRAFGAKEQFRLPMANGKIGHAALVIGDSVFMLSDEFPDWGSVAPSTVGGTTGSLMLYVQDADTVFAQALAAGAEEFMPLQDQFWGDRMGTVTDPFGHRWSIATQVEAISPEELEKRMKAFSEGA
ncbi:MAG: VOC family protein, partial [Verrucomicrobiota bacterium]